MWRAICVDGRSQQTCASLRRYRLTDYVGVCGTLAVRKASGRAYSSHQQAQPARPPAQRERDGQRGAGQRHEPDQQGHRRVVDAQAQRQRHEQARHAQHAQPLHRGRRGRSRPEDLFPVNVHRQGQPAQAREVGRHGQQQQKRLRHGHAPRPARRPRPPARRHGGRACGPRRSRWRRWPA